MVEDKEKGTEEEARAEETEPETRQSCHADIQLWHSQCGRRNSAAVVLMLPLVCFINSVNRLLTFSLACTCVLMTIPH